MGKLGLMHHNFILQIDQNTNELIIALSWINGITNFIPLRDSAFAHHPRRPDDNEYNFEDFEMGCRAKEKWNRFLDNYINTIE